MTPLSIIFLLLTLTCTYLSIPSAQGANPPNIRNETTIQQRQSHTTVHDHTAIPSTIDFAQHEHHLSNLNATEASHYVTSHLFTSTQERLEQMFDKAKTPQCRAKIASHFSTYLNAIGKETSMPYSTLTKFQHSCPEPLPDFDNMKDKESLYRRTMLREYRPPPSDSAIYLSSHHDLRLVYGIMTHAHADSSIRLVEALYEDGDVFVIHVDAKESSDDTFRELEEYALQREYVHLVPRQHCVRVNWGGFSMVNATFQIMKYMFATLEDSPLEEPMDFHKFVFLSSSSYPIKSTYEIKHRIASYPLDANFIRGPLKPITPDIRTWHYFVECDDAVHRIYRLPPLTKQTHGINLYVSSQWFIISREFVEYLVKAEKGTLVNQYLQYSEHAVVADETFFGTIIRNSQFCVKHHNDNFLYLHFDRWESEVEDVNRDLRKCVHPDPNRCGRSPTTMTVDYMFSLELTGDLFARKFSDDDEGSLVKDIIDSKRAIEEKRFRDIENGVAPETVHHVDLSFEGHGTLIVARETVNDDVPLCLGLGSQGEMSSPTSTILKLVPCFHSSVIPTLEVGWESGGVIEDEVLPHNRWEIGPCNSDGDVKRNTSTGRMDVSPGTYTPTGPHCLMRIRIEDSEKCMDVEGERKEPGGQVIVYSCSNQWNQLFGFGDGSLAPQSSLLASVPTHIVRAEHHKGKEQPKYLCFGASGRGAIRALPWKEEENERNDQSPFVPEEAQSQSFISSEKLPLHLWKDKMIVTVACSDANSVIDLVYVPFIDENTEPYGDESNVAKEGFGEL